MSLRTYIFFVLIVLGISIGLVHAQTESDTTSSIGIIEGSVSGIESEADVSYRQNDFEGSIKLYESEISINKQLKQESAELYYNLGNSYFRDNQIAKAIVNYERALLLNPGDSDIRHNLRFARTKIEDKIDSADSFFVIQWIRSIQNLFTSNTWAIIGVILFLAFIIAIGSYMISTQITIRKVSFYAGLVLLSLVIISNTFSFKQKDKVVNRSTGIIMSASASIYTSPDSHSQELFRLHEGSKVRIKREEGNWIEIVIANGSVGWLQKKNIEKI